VIQVREADRAAVVEVLRTHGLEGATHPLGGLNATHTFRVRQGDRVVFEDDLFALRTSPAASPRCATTPRARNPNMR